MGLRRARSAEEYVEWVKNAVFEVDDLKECLMFESEELARFPAFLEPLEKGIKKVYKDMREGAYHFGREDLPFMEIAYAHDDEIPFNTLLKQINETHRKGLEVDEEES
ncbi:MAG: hypothetical protein ABFS23_13515 [Pseudomonadota bacterium]